jgi:RNA polymerase sigma-70 factor, ECF subfamily
MTLSDPSPSIKELLLHRDFVRALAARLTRDPNSAEDLEQEMWLRAINTPPRRIVSPRGWLTRVLQNLANERRRRDRRRERRERERRVAATTAPSTEALHEHRMLRERLAGSLQVLPEEERTLIELRCHEGLPPREIAARTGIPIGEIHSRLRRGFSTMQKDLDEEYGDRRRWSLALAGLVRSDATAEAAPLASSVLSSAVLWKLTATVALLLAVAWLGVKSLGEDVTSRPDTEGDESIAEYDQTTKEQLRDVSIASNTARRAAIEPDVSAIVTAEDVRALLIVEVLMNRSDERARGVTILVEPYKSEHIESYVMVTGADGRARFENLPVGDWTVSPSHGRPKRAQVTGPETVRLKLTVRRGRELRAYVVAPDNRSVADAEVRVSWPARPDTTFFAGRTNETGNLFLANVSPDAWISASAEGYGSSARLALSTPTDRSGGALRVQLDLNEPCIPLSVRVVDAGVRPVPGARVRMMKKSDPHFDDRGSLRLPPIGLEVEADETGWAVLNSICGEGRFVEAKAPGYAPALLALEPAADAVTLQLFEPGGVHGTVRDTHGTPLAGVQIVVRRGEREKPMAVVETDADGGYHLTQLPPGPVVLEALRSTPEFQSRVDSAVLEAGRSLDWSPRLGSGIGIGGRAVDADGRALAGWIVSLESHENAVACPTLDLVEPRPSIFHTQTDEEGRFFFARAEDRLHWITLRDPQANVVRGWCKDIPLGSYDNELRTTAGRLPTAGISGSVRRADGSIPRATEIHVRGPLLRRARRISLDPRTGEFAIEGLNASLYCLSIWAPGYPAQDLPGHARIELHRGEWRRLGEFSWPPRPVSEK